MQWLQYPLGHAMPVFQGNKAAVPSLRPQSSSLGRWRALPSLQRGLGRALCSGDGKNRKNRKTWFDWLFQWLFQWYIQYISMIFNDSCPVSGGYLTDTWCCHNFLGWILEVIAMFQKRWESSGGVKRCETTKMWGLTTNLNCSIILHQWDLSHHCFIRFHPEKTQEELHFTPAALEVGPWTLGQTDPLMPKGPKSTKSTWTELRLHMQHGSLI